MTTASTAEEDRRGTSRTAVVTGPATVGQPAPRHEEYYRNFGTQRRFDRIGVTRESLTEDFKCWYLCWYRGDRRLENGNNYTILRNNSVSLHGHQR
jgi:hypothetical protein